MIQQPTPELLKCLVDAHTEPQPIDLQPLWLNETYEGFVCLFCSPRGFKPAR